MKSVVSSARSRPSRVWLHQLYREALSCGAPILMLPCQFFPPLVFQSTGIATSSVKASTTTLSKALLSLPSALCQTFNTHRSGVVQRFSPIHF